MNIDVNKICGKSTGDVFEIIKNKLKTEEAFVEALYIIDAFIEYPDSYESNKERGLKLIKKYEHENERY